MDGMHTINWETTQRDRLMAGLGIGNYRVRNHAFLAKWIWWFSQESNALWRQLIVAQYYSF